jgi:hypothetical protein
MRRPKLGYNDGPLDFVAKRRHSSKQHGILEAAVYRRSHLGKDIRRKKRSGSCRLRERQPRGHRLRGETQVPRSQDGRDLLGPWSDGKLAQDQQDAGADIDDYLV